MTIQFLSNPNGTFTKNIGQIMFVLLALGRSDFPEFCSDSTYEGPILDDPSTYADKKCIIFNNVENITNATISTLTQLEWINLPDTIYIAENAFAETKTLKTAILPKATEIYDNAFLNCEILTDIEIPNVQKIGNLAFKNTYLAEVNAPAVTTIGIFAFSNNFNLKKVRVPAMTSLEAFSFYNCSSLSDIDLSNIESLDLRCFTDCHSIKILNLPIATSITTQATNMTSLEEIIAPKATHFGILFENVNNFKKLIVPSVENPMIQSLPDSIEEVDISNANGMPSVFDHKTKLRNIKITNAIFLSPLTGCVSLLTIDAPNAGTIPVSAFEGCTQLTSVFIPKVTEAQQNSFKGCTNLKTIISDFYQLGESAFEGCESIEELDLHSVTSFLGNNIFRGMKSLRKINLTTLFNGNSYTGIFEGCESLEEVALSCMDPDGLVEDTFNVSKNVINITLPGETCYQNYKNSCKTIDGKLYYKGAYLMPAPSNNNNLIRNVLIGVGVFVAVAIIAAVVYVIVAKKKKVDQKVGTTLL